MKLHLWRMTGIGLLLRLLVVGFTLKTNTAAWFFAQASELAVLGNSLAVGHGLNSPFGGNTGASAFLAPGYPAMVAVVFRVFHPYSMASAAVLMVLQACFGAASVAVLMLLTRRLFGVRSGNVAGVIWALNPPLIWLPVVFWETSLSILLVTLLLAGTVHVIDGDGTGRWVALGVLGAASLLVNPALLTLIACCFVWLIFRCWRRRALGLWLALLVACVLFAPWPMRNYIVLHRFIPLRSNMGYELWQGNRPGGTGFFDANLHLNHNAEQFQEYAAEGEVAYMSRKGAEARVAIAADPGRFARLSLKRLYWFWTGINPGASGLMVGCCCVTLAAGLYGAMLLVRRRVHGRWLLLGPLLLFPLPYYFTHPDYRFRLVVDPILVVIAAYAIAFWKSGSELEAEKPAGD